MRVGEICSYGTDALRRGGTGCGRSVGPSTPARAVMVATMGTAEPISRAFEVVSWASRSGARSEKK